MSLVRVFVVEDYLPFQRFVCSTLANAPELQVVGQVSDGLQAVQKAEELQPDLILLDIGLPIMNGIEAARRIRRLSPQSKIIFVSQESSADVAREAFRLGALGYVVKERAGSELLPAVEAVRQGRQFISQGLSDHGFAHVVESLRKHEVQFYSDDEACLSDFTAFIRTALEAGKAAIAVVTDSRRAGLLHELQRHGIDTAAAAEQGQLILLDVAHALAQFMGDAGPDRERFFSTVEPLILRAAARHKELVVFGEAVGILSLAGKVEAAIELEVLWNELARKHFFHLFCAYPMTDELKGEPYARICAEHTGVLALQL